MVRKEYIFTVENLELLQQAISFHESLKNAYFWNPAQNASYRRANEKKWTEKSVNATIEFEEIIFFKIHKLEFEGKQQTISHKIEIAQSYSESCHNVYHSSTFKIDGIKTNIKKIKNLIADYKYIDLNRILTNQFKLE